MMRRIILTSLLLTFKILLSSNIDSLMLQTKKVEGVALVHTYNRISHHYYHTERDSAYIYAKKALKLLDSFHNNNEAIETYNILGMIASDMGLLEEGFRNLFKALKISEELKDTFQISRLNNNIGVSYMQIKEFNDAEKFLKKAVEFKNAKSVRIAPVYNNLGLIKEVQNKNKEALNYFNLAHKYYVIDKDTTGIAGALGNIGGVKIKLNDIEGGYAKLKESYNLCVKLKDNYRIAIMLNKLSLDYYYYSKEDYEKSLELLYKSIYIAKENKLTELLIDNYYALSIVYSKTDNYKKALEYKQMGLIIQDSVYSLDIKSIIRDMDLRYEDVKKTKEIGILKTENQINEAKEKTQKIWIIILITISVLLLISGFILYKYKIIQDGINEKIVRKNIVIVKQDEKIDINTDDSDAKKYKHSFLEKDTELEIAFKIKGVLKNEKLFKNPDFTINSLSEHINVNRTYVSQVINNYFKKNFNSLVNKYRVKEARIMLLNKTNLSIEGISKEVGFRSKSVFNGSFKILTGVTPSVFIKNSNNNNT